MKLLIMDARLQLWDKKGLTPLFSYDNNRLQAGASYAKMGMDPKEHIPLASYMPDGHKVIEHFFNRFKAALWNSLYEEGPVLSGEELQERVLKIWGQMHTPEHIAHIQKDVDSLPLTYEIIATPAGTQFTGPDGQIHEGVGGDWARRAHR